jgi:hypothetical protein
MSIVVAAGAPGRWFDLHVGQHARDICPTLSITTAKQRMELRSQYSAGIASRSSVQTSQSTLLQSGTEFSEKPLSRIQGARSMANTRNPGHASMSGTRQCPDST